MKPLLRLLSRLLLCALALSAGALSAQPDGATLAHDLGQGGYVIYFRHADTRPASPDPPGVDLSLCETTDS